MIVVKLQGGLGNQLFQYSTAFALSQYKNCALYFDEKYFLKKDNVNHASPMLKYFNIDNKNSDSFLTVKNNSLKFFKNFIAKKTNKTLLVHIKEQQYHFKSLSDLSFESVYLDGYWQSYRYFNQFRNQICEKLKLKTSLPQNFMHFKNKIQTTTSVSLHVRRGDYLNKQNQKIYTSCSENYYADAIRLMQSKFDSPHFFIFSDDTNYLNEAFSWLTDKTIINTNSTITDFQLMRCCNHHITANSTFSWWSAWLNNNQPLIITPKKWFLSPRLSEVDLIPSSWIKL